MLNEQVQAKYSFKVQLATSEFNQLIQSVSVSVTVRRVVRVLCTCSAVINFDTKIIHSIFR